MNRLKIVVVLLVLSVASCSKKRYQVPTGSMEPTILAGTSVVVDLRAYDKADPVRWDVVTFEPPDALYPGGSAATGAKQTWIMRVIGLPGDTVDFGGAEILVNRKILMAPIGLKGVSYVGLSRLGKHVRASPTITSLVLGKDEYFVLGDNTTNTTNANDSRFWGALTRDRIAGKFEAP
jgi:signal peptidase I